jgi:hypothetical protein
VPSGAEMSSSIYAIHDLHRGSSNIGTVHVA